ncbi:50S ribosomal protein L6 [Holospora undulata]|nr:50S ribosomal protein L6 [Holospora undulata]
MVKFMEKLKKELKVKIPRIAANGVKIPKNVEYRQDSGEMIFSFSGQEIRRFVPDYIIAKCLEEKIFLTLAPINTSVLTRKEQRTRISELGTYSSLLKSDVNGILEPFTKVLELVGVGYKAEPHKDGIKLSLGYSHDVICPLPSGVSLTIEKPTVFKLSSRDRVLLGHVVSSILKVRQVEPYKGKGIRIQGQYVRMKQGKTK